MNPLYSVWLLFLLITGVLGTEHQYQGQDQAEHMHNQLPTQEAGFQEQTLPAQEQFSTDGVPERRGLFSGLRMPSFGMPNVSLPSFQMPNINLPSLKMPRFEMPKLEMPNLPKFELPKFEMPKFELPNLPKFEMPKFNLPKLKVPHLPWK